MKISLLNKRGQGLLEYVLIIGLVVIASIGAMKTFGGGLSGKLSGISSGFSEDSSGDIPH